MARRCTMETRDKPEEVTVSFDPEDAIGIFGALRDAICADNLAAVGHALIAYAEANGGAK